MKKLILSLLITISLAGIGIFAESADTIKKQLLDRHNTLREKHDAPALKWDKEIENWAQAWAVKLAREDRMYHRKSNKYGENIYWISGGSPAGDSVVDSWYSEIKFYNFKKPGFSYQAGHFTQVVWKDSTELGCGAARSRRGGMYVVCNYNPPGNYQKRFPKNVLPEK